MINPYDLLNGVLAAIEQRLKDNINADILANEFNLSSVHLQRLFKFAFDKTIGAYIRSRKLAASIEDLLNTDMDIIDIALDYEFEYEQSYIRSFKQEFGLTPGDLRKKWQIVKVTPPINLFNAKKLSDGFMFAPEIVMVPKFHVIGKQYKSTFRDGLMNDPKNSIKFVANERHNIKNAIDQNVIININKEIQGDVDYYSFMPSVQVKNTDIVPEGYAHDTFETALCARFCFIGSNFNELNMYVADEMFKAIDNFMDDEKQNYFLERKRINIERFDISLNKEGYCLWEWFAPVVMKTDKDIPVKKSGIIKTFKQELPALRFIGKKLSDGHVLDLIDKWRLDGLFEIIEKQTDKDLKKLYEGGNSYISLARSNGGKVTEYWMGMFMPEDTKVPEGCCPQDSFVKIDFPKTTIDVCRIYGKRNEIVNFYDIFDAAYDAVYDAACREQLGKEKIQWYFQRFNWHRFFEEDKFGKRLLDYCYFTVIPKD